MITAGTVPVSLGGTGSTTASAARTALGLGTLVTQDSDAVTITGGNISGIVDLAIADGGTGASSVSAARTNLGLGTLATQDTITESQISDLQSYITANSTDTLTNKSGNISQWTNDSGYLTAETNDLSNVSGTLGTANGGTGLTSIGTAGQVLKVNSGATALEFADESGGGGSGSSYIEHSSTVSDSLAIGAGTNRMYVGGTTFSGSGTMAGRLVTVGGAVNFTGSVNTTGVLVNIGVP